MKNTLFRIGCLALIVMSCAPKNNLFNELFTEKYYQDQEKITTLVQQGMYYYWNGGDYKKAEKEFFKGITLKGNLEVVEKFFKDAVELNEYRLDLQHGLASTYVIQNKFNKAFEVYTNILSINSKDFNATILHAGFSKSLGDIAMYNEYISRAQRIDPEKTTHYIQAIDRIDAINTTSFNITPAKQYNDRQHAIVILGYALNENGNMQETLIKRLEKGLELHKIYPYSKIIVSGAVPKQGNTEARLMREWLIKKGVPRNNILVDDRAKDTIGNAFFSIDILQQQIALKYVTLITSASHMRRALNVFTEMGQTRDFTPVWDNLVYLDYPSLEDAYQISLEEQIVIYRDFFRASGIWAYPGLQQ